ncbi:FtsK/SpoIIIE domain-containing protein [Micromonospora sp. 4G57]|uniref:FtsK/SpoIIIE domain-containing protein n=1 Tax=Micromonospora sicca TaxID=2202420 RepID=A0ABU5JP90_9ACTN|nr:MULTISPECIES: FtsK/SpoIIIE domain-containing protein [unclassified Micromonospora]MDZ5447687.1 FtsK/SpoIIIE domain-containing protein [Micromonospora sp. 4G57]MDZ5494406.1 FtsK/SpoIIIE domain-containing protein [Micromonospora sp. 4G53]
MRFVYRGGDGTGQELELRLGRPDATVEDLARALGTPYGVLIDGRGFPPGTGLAESGLVMGSEVAPAVRPPTLPLRPTATLRVVGGLQAGTSMPLLPGRIVIGRGAGADLSLDAVDVSRTHCALEVAADGTVMLTDLKSLNGTDVNGIRLTGSTRIGPDDLICLAGQVLLRVLPPDRLGPLQHVNAVREARPGGTLPFNRAPRVASLAGPPPVVIPELPRSAGRTAFSISALFGPLLLAGAMVVVMGDVRYAFLAALTPIVFLFEFVETRTRGRVSLRRGRRTYAARLAAAREALTVRRETESRQRREAEGDLAEALFRAQGPGLRLWERRRDAADFLHVSVGTADLPWIPPVTFEAREPDPEATDMVARVATLPQVPVVVQISRGGVVGLEGDRTATLAVARAMLCQAVVGSGPADVTLAIFADPDRIADWDWTKWLPHGADLRSGSARFVAVGPEQSQALARRLLAEAPVSGTAEAPTRPVMVVVVDGATLLEGRPCPLRALLAGTTVACGGIVLTQRLPALCTSVLSVDADGAAALKQVTTGEEVTDIIATGIAERDARRLARALARFEDPELRVDGAGLPDQINLLPLLDLPDVSGRAVAQRWRETAQGLRVQAVLGVTERELFSVDLDDDGPHGLIAGTTGSGKSELLRTLIASMAVYAGPEHLTFALVDYKGGGALDECARLPHVVGLVTDLDEQLGERALRCLEAELRHREHALRDAGLSHVRDYQRLRDTQRPDLEPMPRLVVVIDEFATLVKALPDFVESLVSIAQRGRSLGMHLIMATQRPAGSVSDAIKNNVKLRIALRLESSGDSNDVIDNPAAAGIGSRQWGRGYYRLSAREVQPVQTALSTGVTPQDATTAPVTLAPFQVVTPAADGPVDTGDGPTDLQRLVAAAQQACDVAGIAAPRRPWPEPLPPVVALRDLPRAARGQQTATVGLPAYALADDPDRQTQYAVGWDPEAGNLLIYGAVGAGTSTALAALALAVAGAQHPDRHHIFVLDLGAGDLAPLAGLPHTGGYIGAAERERQIRLIRMLRRQLDTRKAGGPQHEWLVLIDNLGALLSDYDKDVAGMSLVEDLARVFADGPAVGIRFAATADRSGAVPAAWSALTQQKLLMRLADPAEYGNFDVPRRSVPGFLPGRAVVAATRQVIQIGFPGPALAAAVAEVAAHWPDAVRTAPTVGLLPRQVTLAELEVRARTDDGPWEIPLGVGDRELAPAGLTLYAHEHALITGPPRSGRSEALCAIAKVVLAGGEPPAVVAFAPRRSPLWELSAPVTVVRSYLDLDAALTAAAGRVLVLVDDAETVDDDLGVLDGWLSKADAGRHLIAAGRADAIRRTYGSWTQRVRDGRCGVLLIPDHDLDGDLLGVVLPRQDRMAPVPGRGYLVANGSVEGVQLARPD